jgi:hypothetical protein
MRVEVSAKLLKFPQQCVCCGGVPDTVYQAVATRTTGKRVVRTDSRSWDFPYCVGCAGHLAHYRAAGTARTAFVLLGLLAGAAVAYGVNWWAGAAALGVGLLLGQLLHGQYMGAARSACLEGCITAGTPVVYQGWYGTVHTFDLACPQYVEAFERWNSAKLLSGNGRR